MNVWLELCGVLFFAMTAYPWALLCCCAKCPLTEEAASFSAVEIFGNAATKYTDADVPDLVLDVVFGPINFVGFFTESYNNEVWHYSGAGFDCWFWIQAPDGFQCGNTPIFRTFGYDPGNPPDTLGNYISESWCCDEVLGESSYSAVGSITTWEAFP